jgi:cephalosporin-C deacetylase
MPLMFDMSLEELKTYKGTNPKPDDFDAFWDQSLEELEAVAPQVELKPAEFQTPIGECSHLYFTGIGEARIHAKLIRPHNPGASPQPAILLFHGYSGKSGDWFSKLAYAASGFTVAALDCRGQGGLSEDCGGVSGNTWHGHIIRGLNGQPDKMLFRQIFLDTVQLTNIVMNMPGIDPDRVAVAGGSQGGGLSLACAALEPRIRRVAIVNPFLCDYRRVWEIDLDVDAYAELRDYFRRFDPVHEHEEAIFTKLGYIDVQHLCPRIKGEVYMAVGLMDKICPPSTQFAAYNKIRAPKSMAVYPDFGHEPLLTREHADNVYQFIADL